MSWKYRLALSFAASVAAAALLSGCRAPEKGEPPVAQHLVDSFSPAQVSGGSKTSAAAAKPFEWRFSDPAAAASWNAPAGVGGFAVADGRLRGRITSQHPVLHLDFLPEFNAGDLLHEIQLRMRVSAGGNVGAHLIGPEPNGLDQALIAGAPIALPNQAPVTPGDRIQTFTIRPVFPVAGADIRQLLLAPVDRPGATFEIESVRLVFRREHLAAIPSGVGWHGLSEVYRETVVARAPESIRWEVTLPDKPRLSVAVGTIDEQPVRFRVQVDTGSGEPSLLMSRTVTTPHRWNEAKFDVDSWAGRKVTLTLAMEGEPGTLGFWGAPTVRRRGELRAAGGKPRPQGVILFIADTLRADRLDAYGHKRPTAPAIARMAREGALFRDAVGQGAWTKISIPAILTSLHPLTSGVRDFPDRVPSSATTLAEVYRKAGYATMGFVSLPFAGAFSNMHQGYEELYERAFNAGSSKTARTITDLLLPWLDRHRDEPFFVLVHVFDPHGPYEPYAPYNRLWADPARKEEHLQELARASAAIQDEGRKIASNATPDEFRAAGVDPVRYVDYDLGWYDGSIRAMDAEIGRVFERLNELGIDRRTMVALTSDHGEEFHDHGYLFHGQNLYSEMTHVPFILRYPEAVAPGTIVEETVATLDLMPTMLDLSGLPVPKEAQGQSNAPRIRRELRKEKDQGERWRARPVFSERPLATSFAAPWPRGAEAYSVIHAGWKLVWNLKSEVGAPPYELFDHRRDPADRHNVAARHPEVVRRLSKLLADWKKDAEARRLPSDASVGKSLSPEELERLRALGYIR